jgi:hypothetical protein
VSSSPSWSPTPRAGSPRVGRPRRRAVSRSADVVPSAPALAETLMNNVGPAPLDGHMRTDRLRILRGYGGLHGHKRLMSRGRGRGRGRGGALAEARITERLRKRAHRYGLSDQEADALAEAWKGAKRTKHRKLPRGVQEPPNSGNCAGSQGSHCSGSCPAFRLGRSPDHRGRARRGRQWGCGQPPEL